MATGNEHLLYIARARNELLLSEALNKISGSDELKASLELTEDTTFYSNAISAAYYCIFYSAKALLAKRGVSIYAPEEHRKTLEAFEALAKTGQIDVELLRIYKRMVVRADELLGIFRLEKSKRGEFTYQKLPQANQAPAKDSYLNAEKFYKNMYILLK
jgi:uncharacterized protein (UPF0332 family)